VLWPLAAGLLLLLLGGVLRRRLSERIPSDLGVSG
jgi:LPXTG-motif cell wall-anchored protein